jgi:hypothetical protein
VAQVNWASHRGPLTFARSSLWRSSKFAVSLLRNRRRQWLDCLIHTTGDFAADLGSSTAIIATATIGGNSSLTFTWNPQWGG